MGLRKKHEYGTKTGEYWKIIGVYPDSMYSSTKIRVALFKDQESRIKDESSYLLVLNFSAPGTQHTHETAYVELKKRAEFFDAEDC